jgi:hypothetical protein
VHVVWSARLPSGQAKIFVRNSPDGVNWPTPAAPLDGVAVGHQYNPDVASARGTITAVFYDSRADPAYSPTLPPGNTADGRNSGPRSIPTSRPRATAGSAGMRRRSSSVASNFNLKAGFDPPFWGDYIYVSAAGNVANVAWTDSRDVLQCTRPTCAPDGFDVANSDENIYGARVNAH